MISFTYLSLGFIILMFIILFCLNRKTKSIKPYETLTKIINFIKPLNKKSMQEEYKKIVELCKMEINGKMSEMQKRRKIK